ncbi:MAG: glycerophosphodiester phosphodiesterase [Gemmatimonadales bacterium]|nr:glycerophosphodiester phosphodiesterase [Gemmatimonadales bacterium]NIN11768.1 glycerophosphodiester phosphodiesterase [Gemmatimonadales bacterium]NIN50324.1 glycerophosphodiester phosphodiesterase [Gemmatimonadales bacterium]NIP07788.1 glycerophosphodiester phosphodiesterase [Gemmatimonadales bacterium]NIQ99220.1 glycerophosphodiester phosphodiesterase [Gemmatimonadales bacterium]
MTIYCRGNESASGTPVPAPLNIAHRGASASAPEHTFAAYDLALDLGADYIEQDLQLTADSVLVVLHDESLDRTARGPRGWCTGRVRDRVLADLRTCDVGSWFNEAHPDRARSEYVGLRIPTLEEVLQRYGRSTRYYIETKQPEAAPGMEQHLVSLLRRFELLPASSQDWTVLIQSFSPESLRKLHTLHEALPLIQLFRRGRIPEPLDSVLEAVSGYAVGIGPSWRDVTSELVAVARRHGLAIHPYTVNEPEDMRRLLDLGVTGLFTDFPERFDCLRR